MNIKPTDKNVLVEMFKVDETTKGGIALPGKRVALIKKATVLDVGPNVTQCKKDDVVLVIASQGQMIDIDHDGRDVKMLVEESVIAVMEVEADVAKFAHISNRGGVCVGEEAGYISDPNRMLNPGTDSD